jgi:hypothetical protein
MAASASFEGRTSEGPAQEEDPMTLVDIVLILIVVGLLLWLIDAYIPMAGGIKSLINVLVFVVVLIWLLQTFGLVGNIPGVRIPHLM